MENFENSEKSNDAEKIKRWEEEEKRVENITDKLGKKIDDEIKDAVIAFHVLGINTHGSCGGHADHRSIAPYIDVWSSEVPELDQKLKKASNKEEAHSIFDEIVRKNLEEREKIKVFLDEFNKNRDIPEYKRIIIKPLAREWSRIENKESNLKEIADISERKKRLLEYQQEMKDFTEFLKNKYFSE